MFVFIMKDMADMMHHKNFMNSFETVPSGPVLFDCFPSRVGHMARLFALCQSYQCT